MIAEITDKITQTLIQSDTHNNTSYKPPEIYQTILNQLICELTPYKACILRFIEGDTLPIFETASIDDIDMTPKRYEIRRIGEGMVGKVAETGQYTVKDVDENLEEFKSRTWIISQNCTDFDISITEWQKAGLLRPSTVRLHKINTLAKSLIDRPLGTLESSDLQKIKSKLKQIWP